MPDVVAGDYEFKAAAQTGGLAADVEAGHLPGRRYALLSRKKILLTLSLTRSLYNTLCGSLCTGRLHTDSLLHNPSVCDIFALCASNVGEKKRMNEETTPLA